jgi:tetratricopeptide (TPR) repeat protein
MRVCSVTLAGPGTEGIIGDALRSVVDEVDDCVIAATDAIDSPTSHAMRDVADGVVGRKGSFCLAPWVDDFAAMRNTALDKAHRQTGCDWALWLDTDERISFVPDWREALNTSAAVVTAWHVSGEYNKERFIQLPRQGGYVGPTHEYFVPKTGRTMIDTRLVTFDELPRDKDSPAWTAKLARDRRALTEYITTHANPRWLYYLGDTLSLMGEWGEANAAWFKAVRFYATNEDAEVVGDEWDEIRGWAAFRSANVELRANCPRNALAIACEGIARFPHAPELFWIAAGAAFDLGEWEKAICFAMHSAAAGTYKGWGRGATRTGFLYPPAWWEGPFDILSLAYEKSGRHDMALAALQEFASAKRMREGARPPVATGTPE